MPATLLELAIERTKRAFQYEEDCEDGGGRENFCGDARVDAWQLSKYIKRDTIRKFHCDIAIALYTAGIERHFSESRRHSSNQQYQDCEHQVSWLQETICRQQTGETDAGGDGRAVELAVELDLLSPEQHSRGAFHVVAITAAFASGDHTTAKAAAVEAQLGLLEESLVLECSAAKSDLGNICQAVDDRRLLDRIRYAEGKAR